MTTEKERWLAEFQKQLEQSIQIRIEAIAAAASSLSPGESVEIGGLRLVPLRWYEAQCEKLSHFEKTLESVTTSHGVLRVMKLLYEKSMINMMEDERLGDVRHELKELFTWVEALARGASLSTGTYGQCEESVDGRHCGCWFISGEPCCECGAEAEKADVFAERAQKEAVEHINSEILERLANKAKNGEEN